MLRRCEGGSFKRCRSHRVSSLSLVRYRTNDYSVPVAYGHRDVLVKGYVDEVVISCGAEVIARHPRSYEQEDFIFDPMHYLPLLERKIGALDQAAPLAGWDLPEEYATLRHRLEARMSTRGKREFVRVLRLMEDFSQPEVSHVNYSCRPVASLGNVTETLAPGIRSHQGHFRHCREFRHGLASRGVDQLFGHDAAPLLHPALQGPQLSPAEAIRFSLLQSAQQCHRAGVRVFLQPGQHVAPDAQPPR